MSEPRLLLDDRTGAKELLSLFPKGFAQLTRLEYGDMMLLGNGPDGAPVPILVERKRISDMLTSMASGRFAGHQLPGLLAASPYVYLLIEGVWSADHLTGLLTHPKGKRWVPFAYGQRQFLAKELFGHLNTICVLCGVHLAYTPTPQVTVLWLRALCRWWQSKQFDEHQSHKQRHHKADAPRGKGVRLVKTSLVRRIAAELPGVGWGRSRDVAAHFGSVFDMVLADEAEWRKVPGIGKIIAQKVVRDLQEGK